MLTCKTREQVNVLLGLKISKDQREKQPRFSYLNHRQHNKMMLAINSTYLYDTAGLKSRISTHRYPSIAEII